MLKEQVKRIIEDIVGETEFFLVDLSMSESGNKITAYMDSDTGISISQCADLSRRIGKVLDEKDWGNEPYNLEVSSPGLKRSLELQRQYKKNVGRNIEVEKADGTPVSGKLVYVDEEKIIIQKEEKKETEDEAIGFLNIKKAQIVI